MSNPSDITPDVPVPPSDEDGFVTGRGHGHKSTERKDIASGEVMDPARMIRLAFSPDGDVVADVFAKLPGRGAWVAANREAVETAIRTQAFARAAKRKVQVPDGFADLIEQHLSRRVLALLGMANRAGELESGFDKVRSVAQAGLISFRVEASDGSEDGRSKIRVITKAVANEMEQLSAPVIGCFNATELGQIMGREHMVHLAVRKGRLARALRVELSRLAGFRDLIPDVWTDKEHEPEFVPFAKRRHVSREPDISQEEPDIPQEGPGISQEGNGLTSG
ncbi:MAG: DNA-binding protein [Robiginitomaculum sp.]|nr:MAG: DNA-binding protein [Robiginitomaculum sp.]